MVYYLPYKILAVGTEGGLLEEARHELVVFYEVNILLFERAFAAPEPQVLGGAQFARFFHHIVVRHGCGARPRGSR